MKLIKEKAGKLILRAVRRRRETKPTEVAERREVRAKGAWSTSKSPRPLNKELLNKELVATNIARKGEFVPNQETKLTEKLVGESLGNRVSASLTAELSLSILRLKIISASI